MGVMGLVSSCSRSMVWWRARQSGLQTPTKQWQEGNIFDERTRFPITCYARVASQLGGLPSLSRWLEANLRST